MCAHLERHVFSLINRFVVFMRKTTALFWRKLASEKEAHLDKIGHFTNSVAISFETFIHTPKERKRESIENDDRLLEVRCDRMFVV